MQVEHGGGQKMVIGDRTYKQFRRFIDDYASIVQGKYIGINQMGITATQLKLEGDLSGLVELAEKQESKIFKALQVPQFLVQSEDIANRATADKSAELFLNGVISKDHKWLERG